MNAWFSVDGTVWIGLRRCGLAEGVGIEVSRPKVITREHSLLPTCSSRCEPSASAPAIMSATDHDGLGSLWDHKPNKLFLL